MKEQGPVFRMSTPRGEQLVVCGHEANLATWKSPSAWVYGPPSSGGNFFSDELGALHISQLDGDAHRRARKLILPSFGIASLMRDLDVVSAVIRDGIDALADKEINLHEALSLVYTKALTKSQVKVELSDEQIKNLFAFEESFISAGPIDPDDRAAWYATPRYKTLRAEAFAIFEHTAKARLAGERNNDSVDLILDRKAPAGMAPFNEEEMVLAVYLLIVAGVGNIANIACALIWALTQNPLWIEKLREELASFNPAQLRAGMKNLPVVQAVISEAERCYLPAPVVPKMAGEDVNILGFDIPAGTHVLHLHGLAHFQEERYPSPGEFRPERWLDGSADRPNAFGGGIHLCLGMGVAKLYLPLTLAMLIPKFDVIADIPPVSVPIDPEMSVSPGTTRFNVLLKRSA